jgi:tetratricopeptide (TPR) repeat protein
VIRLVTLALLALLSVGCVTSERIPDALAREVDEEGNVSYRQTRRLRAGGESNKSEAELVRDASAHPKDPTAWWRLGELYDRLDRQPEALQAFLRLQKVLRELSVQEGRDYPQGDYFVGRTYALLGDWDQARIWLRKVLEREPKSRWRASRAPWWRESHFLLGSIHYAHEEWAGAERHLERYQKLSGDTLRPAAMLARVERELYPERYTTNYAKVR